MFFEGSLQEGIATAVAQSKLVLCFVTDGGRESEQWEDEFLADESLKPALANQAISLRLTAGSQEAGFLELIVPVPKKPAVVIIQNGQLREYVVSGTSKEEFLRRITGSFHSTSSQSDTSISNGGSSLTTQTAQTSTPASQVQGSRTDDDLYNDFEPAPAPPTVEAAASSTTAGPSDANRRAEGFAVDRLHEQNSRVEADRKLREIREAKEKSEAAAEIRRKAEEKSKSEQKHAETVRLQRQQANEDRQRVLKRIEDDKLARKKREAEERKARELLSSNENLEGEEEGSSNKATSSIHLGGRTSTAANQDTCNLQIRLLDGATIRHRFSSDSTLKQEVRKWVDQERTDSDAPYTFRIVLTPLPNKAIQRTEESQSLLDLGLAPSATLVLVPVKYASAFAVAPAGGFLSSILGVFSSGLGAISAALGGFLAMFLGRRPPANSTGDGVPLQTLGRNPRVRGFQNPEDRRNPALYNGNSLSFEPYREEGEDHSD